MLSWLPFVALAIAAFDLLKRRRSRARREKGGDTAASAAAASGPVDGAIYQFGLISGNDLAYYLVKGEKVIVVEADKSACDLASRRFELEIKSGRLVIVNCAVAEDDSAEPLPFYIHESNRGLNGVFEPHERVRAEFAATSVPRRTPSGIVQEFGRPSYVTVNVGRDDVRAIRELFGAGIFPPEISAAGRLAQVFPCLVENGYPEFALVDGRTVPEVYGNTIIHSPRGVRRFSFENHSCGPFGDDIRGSWHDADSFASILAAAGRGPKYIHARRATSAA